MTCPECTAARANPLHGIYRMGCFGCEMRGFARSVLAFEAAKTGKANDLRDAVLKSHPKLDPAVCLKAIREWWDHDHPKETT